MSALLILPWAQPHASQGAQILNSCTVAAVTYLFPSAFPHLRLHGKAHTLEPGDADSNMCALLLHVTVAGQGTLYAEASFLLRGRPQTSWGLIL